MIRMLITSIGLGLAWPHIAESTARIIQQTGGLW